MKVYYWDSDDVLGLLEPITALCMVVILFFWSVCTVCVRFYAFMGSSSIDASVKTKRKINAAAIRSKRLACSVAFLAYILRPMWDPNKIGLAELIQGSDPKVRNCCSS